MTVLDVEIEIGGPRVLGPLAVFPLVSVARGTSLYLAGPDAFGKGLVEVSELAPPRVGALAVDNRAPVPLLLLEGETLLGGDQNRTLNTTVLVPANASLVVPVSCVEAGRWGMRKEVVRSRAHLPGSVRAAKIANLATEDGPGRWRSDQAQVWEEVDKQAQRHGVRSDTAALEDVQRSHEVRLATSLGEVVPQPSQVGVACVAGGRVLGVDLFGRPETLAAYLTGLIAGYWLDAEDGTDVTESGVERFLAEIGKAAVAVGRGVGIGEELRLRGNVTGVGLRAEGELVHLAAFPNPELVP